MLAHAHLLALTLGLSWYTGWSSFYNSDGALGCNPKVLSCSGTWALLVTEQSWQVNYYAWSSGFGMQTSGTHIYLIKVECDMLMFVAIFAFDGSIHKGQHFKPNYD